MSRAAQKLNRAALIGCGTLILLLAPLFAPPADAAATPGDLKEGADAGISIVNGQTTTIEQWPWQVGLTAARRVAPDASTSRRFFCGGSVLAPRLIITAGHCVADLKTQQVRRIEIVSGRTRLNSNEGEIAGVVERIMPRSPSGRLRYRNVAGTADWDVALLRLDKPLSAEPIKIAGADESAAWAPGQPAVTTGWGITKGYGKRVSPQLRLARQVIMPDGVCKRADGVSFRKTTMNCLGGPGGHSSTCNGDSGGPLVVQTSLGYRLVGLTSFGDGGCRGFVPSVDARVAADPIRGWVARTALRLEGVDVLGSGGSAPPVQEWCRMPEVFGMKVPQARRMLLARGCQLGKVRVDPFAAGPKGRIVGYSRLPGWLAPLGGRLDVWISP